MLHSLQKVFGDARERNDFLWALVVLIFFGGLIYQYGWKKIYMNKTTEDSTVFFSDSTTNESANHQDALPLEVFFEKLDTARQKKRPLSKDLRLRNDFSNPVDSLQMTNNQQQENDRSLQDSVTEITSKDLTTNPIIDSINMEKDIVPIDRINSTDTLSTLTTADPITADLSEEPSELEEINTSSDRVEKEEISNDVVDEEEEIAWECLVIAGAFEFSNNARKYHKELITSYPTAVIGNYRKYKYVGIPVVCDDKERIQLLQNKINQTEDIKSWVLYKK